MELKVRYPSQALPNPGQEFYENPFNGIESGISHPPQFIYVMLKNPFNGIERRT